MNRKQRNNNNPPQFHPNVRVSHKYRFQAVAAFTDTAITRTMLISASGVLATTTVLGYSPFLYCRVKRISMWAGRTSASGTTANATVSCIWSGDVNNFGGSYIEMSDTTVNDMYSAHVSGAPPAKSFAGEWAQGSANVVAILSGPIGTIIDVELDLVMNDAGETNTAVSQVLTAATVGQMYYLALDGSTLNNLRTVSQTGNP
jgi:hypothetical protein